MRHLALRSGFSTRRSSARARRPGRTAAQRGGQPGARRGVVGDGDPADHAGLRAAPARRVGLSRGVRPGPDGVLADAAGRRPAGRPCRVRCVGFLVTPAPPRTAKHSAGRHTPLLFAYLAELVPSTAGPHRILSPFAKSQVRCSRPPAQAPPPIGMCTTGRPRASFGLSHLTHAPGRAFPARWKECTPSSTGPRRRSELHPLPDVDFPSIHRSRPIATISLLRAITLGIKLINSCQKWPGVLHELAVGCSDDHRWSRFPCYR